MAPKPAAIPLGPAEYLEKISSPKVDIYVGSKRKHFAVPKGLLAHYSGFFARQFTVDCKVEGVDDPIYLTDEDPDDFALLVDYLYRERVLTSMPEVTDAAKMAHCLRFIEFVGKLDFGEAASIVGSVLADILSEHATYKNPTALIEPRFIKVAFEVIPANHNIILLLTQATLPETMKRSGGKFKKELVEVEGFLQKTWELFHLWRDDIRFEFPLKAGAKKSIV